MNKDITINFVRMNGILHLQKKTLGKVSLGVKLKRVVWNVTAVYRYEKNACRHENESPHMECRFSYGLA